MLQSFSSTQNTELCSFQAIWDIFPPFVHPDQTFYTARGLFCGFFPSSTARFLNAEIISQSMSANPKEPNTWGHYVVDSYLMRFEVLTCEISDQPWHQRDPPAVRLSHDLLMRLNSQIPNAPTQSWRTRDPERPAGQTPLPPNLHPEWSVRWDNAALLEKASDGWLIPAQRWTL